MCGGCSVIRTRVIKTFSFKYAIRWLFNLIFLIFDKCFTELGFTAELNRVLPNSSMETSPLFGCCCKKLMNSPRGFKSRVELMFFFWLEIHHTTDGYVNVTVYSNTCEVCVYAEAMLLLVFHSHMGPQCIVGVGVVERSHLLQDNSYIERKSEGDHRGRVKD